jgi:hypothetical protein
VIPQVALILWIFISMSLFSMLSPLRAFLITYVVGLLFLPVEITTPLGYHIGSIVFTQSLRVDKFAACHIGAILGTLLFAPHVLRRYRFQWLDLAYALVIIGQFLTSIVNDLGAKDGFSSGIQCLRDYLPIIILARLYITSFPDLLQTMRTIIGGAFVYSAICVLEWRFSPQLHTYLYGYFQHSFDEFVRFDHFRPIGFLRHAIELSVFMATSAVMAGWLHYKKMLKPLWGFVPPWAVIAALLIGLAVTMTFSGYASFLLCIAILVLVRFTRTRWVLVILPVVAIAWMVGRSSRTLGTRLFLDITRKVNPEHIDSLIYRLNSEQLNLASVSRNFFLGQGTLHGAARDSEGNFVLALDAWWLINLVFFGIIGLGAWFLVWSSCILETLRRWRFLAPDAKALAALVCVLIGAQFMDFLFNSFPSTLLLILNVGLISAIQRYQPARVVRRVVRAPAFGAAAAANTSPELTGEGALP